MLTGLAVAFAFRCGMFNIGGQGQYFIGLYVANWIGHDFAGMATFPHILLAVGGATLGGALWAGIAGVLKATVGAHEVITTIMLNWIAIWIGTYLFGDGGLLQNGENKSLPISNDIANSAKLPVFWGDKDLQGLHIGIFIAGAALIVFWLILNRTTMGYEVRAVGFNPNAAAYGGISVPKNLIRAMAISGAFAGPRRRAGHARLPLPLRRLGHPRRPRSASSGSRSRCSAATRPSASRSARCCSARCSTGRRTGSTRTSIQPELAGNLTYIIQGLIVLFVGADVADPLRLELAAEAAAQAGEDGVSERSTARSRVGSASAGSSSPSSRRWSRVPPVEARSILWSAFRRDGRRHDGALGGAARSAAPRLERVRRGPDRGRPRHPRDASSTANLERCSAQT